MTTVLSKPQIMVICFNMPDGFGILDKRQYTWDFQAFLVTKHTFELWLIRSELDLGFKSKSWNHKVVNKEKR